MTWWLVSLLGLVVAAAWSWKRFDAPAWQGSPGPHGPTEIVARRGRTVSVRAGVPTACRVPFELKVETWVDSLAKGIGMSVEGQVGCDEFDRQLYLISDDPRVLALLYDDARLRAALLELAGTRVPPGFRFVRLACAHGVVYADYAATARNADPAQLIGGLQLRLQRLARTLPAAFESDLDDRDPLAVRARPYLAFALALFVLGAVQGLWEWQRPLPHVLDRDYLWLIAVVVAALVSTLSVLFTWARLGRTSRAHLVVLPMLLLFAPGALFISVPLVRELNALQDARLPLEVEAEVLDASSVTSRFAPDRFRLRVRLDAEHPRLPLEHWLVVDREDYTQFPPGSKLRAIVRQGSFGLIWIERFEVAQAR